MRLFAVIWWLVVIGTVLGTVALGVDLFAQASLDMQRDPAATGVVVVPDWVAAWWWLSTHWPFYVAILLPLFPLAALIVGRWVVTDRWHFGPR